MFAKELVNAQIIFDLCFDYVIYSGGVFGICSTHGWAVAVNPHRCFDEIPDALKSSRCDIINEHVLEAARKQNCIVQKAQVVWELKGERWWATVYTTFPVRDFDSNRSIKHYKP